MAGLIRAMIAAGVLLLVFAATSRPADGHAALERSEPAAGQSLGTLPTEIRLWFTEPLEQTFTGADLLDVAGNPVAGTTASISPRDSHELILDLPEGLPAGAYTVAWRTLSSADGHTLEGFFGFRVGSGPAAQFPSADAASAGRDRLRPLSRGVALIGLAALLAIPPLTLGLFDPLMRSQPVLAERVKRNLRRYAVLATGLAVLGSGFALAAQAAAIAPDAPLISAVAQTLGSTRYGQLWLLRLALLLAAAGLVAAAFWGRASWRRPVLSVGSLVSLVLPVPFSLLSHAAAQPEGRASAIASDVIHLLAASLWAGGLFMLVLVLAPAAWRADPAVRHAALRMALPRFSVLGVAAWAVLLLSGIYASWIQVGAIDALLETDYGQTLLLKGVFLLPVLALAAFHFVLGWRGSITFNAQRLTTTMAIEACIVVAVLLIVGRLIGLEPAREVMASRTPGELTVPLAFPAGDEERGGSLVISPGVAGNNTFTVQVDGAALPAGSEAVLRVALPSQNMGEQEIRLPEVSQNTFRATGSEISLVGDWQVTVIVRKIGDFSWHTQRTVPIGNVPPATPQPNPPPRFGPYGVAGMAAVAVGIAALAAAGLARGAATTRRTAVAATGGVLLIAGAVVLGASRLPERNVIAATGKNPIAPSVATTAASPAAPALDSHDLHMDHASPEPAPGIAAAGTPVAVNGLTVTIAPRGAGPGPVDITIDVATAESTPLAGARIVVWSEMPGMDSDREQTSAMETAPGRYLAAGVPLNMPGEWRIAVRISPKGESTQIIPFIVEIP